MTQPAKRQTRFLLIVMVTMMAVVAVAVVVMWRVVASGPHDPGHAETVAIGGPFSLTDQSGAPVTDQTYQGRYRLIYFGYTFCPDACPTALQVMAQAIDGLGADGDRVQPIFITVDPDRDTVAKLADYVKLFHKNLVGLTGSPAEIAQAAKAYRVYYAKAEAPNGGPYAMNHSSFVYLMDPGGKFLTVFPSDMDGNTMAAEIRRYMALS